MKTSGFQARRTFSKVLVGEGDQKLVATIVARSFATEKLQSPQWGHATQELTVTFIFRLEGGNWRSEPALAVAMCGPPEASPSAMLLLQTHDYSVPGSPRTMPKTMAQMRRSQAIGSLQGTSSYERLQRREAWFLWQGPSLL